MKRLLIIVLSSIFLGASLCSYAGEGSSQLPQTESDFQTYCQGTVDFSAINDSEALLSPAHFRRVSVTHFRLQAYTSSAGHEGSAVFLKVSSAPVRFYKPYVYCKPIRLKLVFPQHYFW